jgi:hypothetical protein
MSEAALQPINPEASSSIIQRADLLSTRILEWKAQGCHVLAPAVKIGGIARHFGVNVSAVFINPDPSAGECYCDKALMKEDERALSRIGLQKIAQCAGISWLPASGRTDDRRIQHLWEYRAIGAYVGLDGAPQLLQGTAEVDLRDGSAQIGGWTPERWRELLAANAEATRKGQKETWQIGGWSEARVLQARRFGLRLAETKAMLAAVRSLGLKAKYLKGELSKPFIVLRTQYLPDHDDPATRAMVAQNALLGAAALYANGPAEVVPFRRELPEAPMVETIDAEALPEMGARALPAAAAPAAEDPQAARIRELEAQLDAARAEKPAAAAPPAAASAAPAKAEPIAHAPAAPLPADARRLMNVESKTIQKRDKSGSFRKYFITDDHGVTAATINGEHGKLAIEAYEGGRPVLLRTEYDEKFRETKLLGIAFADGGQAQPALPQITDADIPF